MTRIGDQLARELGITIHHGQADVRHVWHHNTSHQPQQPYHETGGAADAADTHPKGTVMNALADIATALEAHAGTIRQAITDTENIAARLVRFESNPIAAEAVDLLEAFPAAGPILRAALDTAKLVAAAAPPPAAPSAAEPAPPEPTGVPADLQQQHQTSGIAS